MAATITTAKAVLFLLALFCAMLQWTSLQSQLSYQSLHDLAQDAGRGRLEVGDAEWLGKALAASSDAPAQALRSIALLYMYNVDIIATSEGLSPFQPSQNAVLTTARLKALAQAKAALARTPADGDLWLRLAFLERALDSVKNNANLYLNLSRQLTPHEGWIMQRRPASF